MPPKAFAKAIPYSFLRCDVHNITYSLMPAKPARIIAATIPLSPISFIANDAKSATLSPPKNAPKTQFCDSCYGHKHVTDLREAEEKGKQPPPTAEWVVQRCCECEERKIKNVLLFLCIFFFIFCLKFNLICLKDKSSCY